MPDIERCLELTLIHSSLSAKTEKKVFNGTVTKFIDNFGFVDDDVFFRIEYGFYLVKLA